MPGIDLNLDLPTPGDSLSTVVSKLTTALSLIEDDLTDKITSGEIEINAQLSANGQALINVGGLQLAGGLSTTVGTLYMDGSDLWVHTADGAVKLTAAGAVNIAASGGIGGDYGSGDEIATYDLASQEYRFFYDPATAYGDLVADDVVLMESLGGGSVRLDVDATITTARTFKFKTLNSGGVSMLVFDASTSTLETSDTKRATNVVQVTTLNASTSVTVPLPSSVKHGDSAVFQPPTQTGFGTVSTGLHFLRMSPTTWSIPLDMKAGQRVKKVAVYAETVATPTLTIYKHTLPIANASQGYTYSVGGGFDLVGGYVKELVLTVPVTLAAGERLHIEVQNAAQMDLFGVLITYDTP